MTAISQADRFTHFAATFPRRLFIDGSWVDAADATTMVVDNPATGTVLTTVADASPQDGRRALDAAVRAQRVWGKTAPRERSDILRRAFELVLAREDDLALLMTLEMGKPLGEARGEGRYAAAFLRWFSEEAVRIDGGYAATPDGTKRAIVVAAPVGPCLLITRGISPSPWAPARLGPRSRPAARWCSNLRHRLHCHR